MRSSRATTMPVRVPGSPDALQRGHRARQAGDPGKALACYREAVAEHLARRALAQDPQDVSAWKTLVQLRGGYSSTRIRGMPAHYREFLP